MPKHLRLQSILVQLLEFAFAHQECLKKYMSLLENTLV